MVANRIQEILPSIYPPSPRRKALLIGLAEGLRCNPKEITAMEEVLINNVGFLKENVIILSDHETYIKPYKNAIKRTIKAMLETKKDEASPIISLFVFGHGGSNNKRPAIFPTQDYNPKGKGLVITG